MTMPFRDISAFNDEWLRAWSDKDIPRIVAMYAEDCRFFDAATAKGLDGRAALTAYLEGMFSAVPAWHYRSDALWPIAGGFCARWFCDMVGGRRLRGFDFVQLRGREIAVNEVYTHEI